VAPLRLGVLVSGRGTNLQALLDAQGADYEVVVVVSNRPGVPALERAARAGVAAVVCSGPDRAAEQREAAARLRAARVDLVVLAGFDRILGREFFETLDDVPVISTHPSLLPRYGGRGMIGARVHEAVLAAGERETGCTIFRVSPTALDEGEILVQRRVPVLPADTSRTLEERVLREEHRAIVDAVRTIAREEA
jgi:phosphoribosylglycinamide formyltransferase-1